MIAIQVARQAYKGYGITRLGCTAIADNPANSQTNKAKITKPLLDVLFRNEINVKPRQWVERHASPFQYYIGSFAQVLTIFSDV